MKSKPTKKTPRSHSASKSSRPIPPLLQIICRALDEKKAGDVRVLRVSEKSSITDFLIIATGTSEPHLRALRVELEKSIDATGTRIVGMDTGEVGSGWMVIDAFDVMVHVLTHENREHYSLEKLWKDAEEIPLRDVLGTAAPASSAAKKKKTAAKKTSVKKTPTTKISKAKPVAKKKKSK